MTPSNASSIEGLALVVRKPGDLGLEMRSVLAPGPREVQIVPVHVGICGTDLEIINGAMDPDYVSYPIVLGHEWSGRVTVVGERVTRVGPGDAVVVEGIVPDGLCDACRRGQTNLCATYDELGFVRDGAAGPGVTIAEHLVHRLHPSVSIEVGALVEPAAVVLRGLSEMDLQPGADVLVVGDGTVGLLAANLAALWSPGRVVVTGQRSGQEELARAMGADEFLLRAPVDRSFDLVIEAAGNISAVATALGAARRGGQVLLLGISGHGKTLPLSTDDFVNKDLRIRGSFSYTAAAWAQTTHLINVGRFDPTPLITHRYRLDQYKQALATLTEPIDGPRGKVMFDLGTEK